MEGGNGGTNRKKRERERSSDSPQRTDHHQLKKVKGGLTAKETRDWPVKALSCVSWLCFFFFIIG